MLYSEPYVRILSELGIKINDPRWVAWRLASGPSLEVKLHGCAVQPGQNIGIDDMDRLRSIWLDK